MDVPDLTANMFASATDRTNRIKQGKLAEPLSSLPKYDVYDWYRKAFQLKNYGLIGSITSYEKNDWAK
jgi:hypothetical protein